MQLSVSRLYDHPKDAVSLAIVALISGRQPPGRWSTRRSTVVPEMRFSNTEYAVVIGLSDGLQSPKVPFLRR